MHEKISAAVLWNRLEYWLSFSVRDRALCERDERVRKRQCLLIKWRRRIRRGSVRRADEFCLHRIISGENAYQPYAHWLAGGLHPALCADICENLCAILKRALIASENRTAPRGIWASERNGRKKAACIGCGRRFGYSQKKLADSPRRVSISAACATVISSPGLRRETSARSSVGEMNSVEHVL